MRYVFAVLLMLMSSAAMASAQVVSSFLSTGKQQARVSADDIIARLMQFDRNHDFKLAMDELPERMQTLVVRGDKSDDLMLDASEIRRMTQVGPEMPVLFPSPQVGGYGFGDTGTLSSRTHIENTIEDLRLEPAANVAAKRIGAAFADELEALDLGKLPGDSRLGEARQAVLADRLSSVLTDEENQNFRAALARRPLVKAGVQVMMALEVLRQQEKAMSTTLTPPPSTK